MTTSALIKDPTTGAFTLAPGAGNQPLNSSPTVGSLGIGSPAIGTGGAGDPYTAFNQNIAQILAQIQAASTSGRAQLGGAKDALVNESVGAGGAYDPTATPGANLQDQTGSLAAFAPAVTSINTQLQNTDAALKDLEANIGTIQAANQPEVLSPGQSLVTKGGQTITQGHQFTPQMNPNTGMLDGFDVNTGTWASQVSAGQGGTGSGNMGGAPGVSTSIDGIFGSKNPMGAYASDPNYVSEVSGLYTTVAKLGVAQTPDLLDQYIKNNAGSAPVTGQMILNAAQTYGVDPALLTTILLHESDFGTAGVGAKTMNPGNQGNTGTSTQQFPSWQQGVMATAKNIANRMAAVGANGGTLTAGTTAPQTDTSRVGGAFSDAASQKVSQLPQAYQSYVDAGPLGVAYINDDRVPDNVKAGLQSMASRAGIPYVKAADVGAIKSMETVLNSLDNMQVLADKNLGSGVFGHAVGMTLGNASMTLQTPWGQDLGLFDNYRDVAIKAVSALAGGAGSGLRINGAEIAANTQNLPQATDNIENATKQIKQLKQLIYTQLSTTFPYASVAVLNPNGQSGQIPASNLSAAIAAGYTVK